MITYLFNLCVVFLVWLAKVCHTDYETINIIIFCVIWPAITLGLMAWVYSLRQTVKFWRNYVDRIEHPDKYK